MKMNFLVLGLAALIPLVLGFIWYHPKVFGNAWMKSLGFTEDKMKEGFNMPLVFGLTYLFSFFLAFALQTMVIHQVAIYQLTMHFEKDPATQELLGQIMSKYGTEFRNIHHGLIHGFIGGLTIAFPIVAVNALFERRSWKYIFMNAGYWIVSMMLMGAVICKFA